MSPPNNPYLRPVARAVAAPQQQQENVSQSTMGPQSQRRLTLQERTHQLQSSSHKKKQKISGQQTLFGGQAFDPTKNCPKCRGGPSSHKGHDSRCWNNKQKSKSMQAMEDIRLRQHFAAPLTESEKCSGKYLTKEATETFFAPREGRGDIDRSAAETAVEVTMTTTTTTTTATAAMTTTLQSGNDLSHVTPRDFHDGVTTMVQDLNFLESTKSSRAPLPMLAFAKVVVDQVLRPRSMETHDYFNGITITTPELRQHMSPECHSIVGQKLLYVDWKKM